MGASGSSEGRDSWQRAQAGVSLAPPGCLRGPGAASPVTGPQLQVEQSPGGEKAEWGQSSLLPSAKADWGVSARPHAAPRPAMGPVAAAHCLPRARVDSSFSSEEGAAEAASCQEELRPYHNTLSRSREPRAPYGQQVPHRGSQRQARPAASCISHGDQKDEGAASGAAQAGCQTTSQPAGPGGEHVCNVTRRAWYSAPRQGNQNPAKN